MKLTQVEKAAVMAPVVCGRKTDAELAEMYDAEQEGRMVPLGPWKMVSGGYFRQVYGKPKPKPRPRPR